MGCLTPKGVWGHGIRVLGVSHDMGSPAGGCPVIHPTTQGILNCRVSQRMESPDITGIDARH